MVGGVVGERVEMIHCVSGIGSMDNEELYGAYNGNQTC